MPRNPAKQQNESKTIEYTQIGDELRRGRERGRHAHEARRERGRVEHERAQRRRRAGEQEGGVVEGRAAVEERERDVGVRVPGGVVGG